MRKLRIILVINRFGDVGSQPQLSRLALHLKAQEHEVLAVSLSPPGTLTGIFNQAGIEIETIDASWMGAFLPVVGRLTMLFRRWQPDAVVAFLYGAIIPVRMAARLAGVRAVVASIRNEFVGPRYRELALRATERLSVATVVNSHNVAESLVRRRVASRRHLVVIPNGVDLASFPAAPESRDHVRSSLGLSDDEYIWLSIGRLTHQKDYPTLFQAFSRVRQRTPHTRLLVAGRGPMQPELERLVRESRLQDGISFLGFRSDIPELLAAADASVMSSRWEGMPNAVMQALSAGLPVVGTAVGGMGELVQDGVHGYLVAPGNADELAEAMMRMMDAPPERRLEMGRMGQAHMRQHFEVGTVMDSWSRLITDAVRSKVRSRGEFGERSR